MDKRDVERAVKELDTLCWAEYGIDLEQLLTSDDPVAPDRLQRLTGIMLKRKFATESDPSPVSETRARRSWPWRSGDPIKNADNAKEFELLEKLLESGPWNEEKPQPGTGTISWQQLKVDAEHERGLFKIVALYVAERIQGKQGRSLKEYLEVEESRRFGAGLDIATLVFDAAVTAPLASVLGVPSVVVGLAMVGIQYGYRKLTDPTDGRRPDASG